MAIEIEDYWLIKNFCEKYKLKGKVLILGDCYYHFKHKDIKIEKKDNIQNDVFINTLGFCLAETIDIMGNPTFKLDLAADLPKSLIGKYDFIIDAGTLCCCFDVPSVLKNLHLLLKDNGHVLHISYFSGFFGRGYYSLQPNFYQDYYKINKYILNYLGVRKRNKFNGVLRKIFSRKYLWNEMDLNARYYDGDRLSINYVIDPATISNNMVIAAFAKKVQSSIVIIPTPKLLSGAINE